MLMDYNNLIMKNINNIMNIYLKEKLYKILYIYMIYIYMKVKELWIKFIVKDYNGQKK